MVWSDKERIYCEKQQFKILVVFSLIFVQTQKKVVYNFVAPLKIFLVRCNYKLFRTAKLCFLKQYCSISSVYLRVISEHPKTTSNFLISVQIRSNFWSVFFCIRTEYREIRTRNHSVFGHFSRSVQSTWTRGIEVLRYYDFYFQDVFSLCCCYLVF